MKEPTRSLKAQLRKIQRSTTGKKGDLQALHVQLPRQLPKINLLLLVCNQDYLIIQAEISVMLHNGSR